MGLRSIARWISMNVGGELAQMVERSLSMREVRGSMPRFSRRTFFDIAMVILWFLKASSCHYIHTLKLVVRLFCRETSFPSKPLPRVRIELTTFRWLVFV